MSRTGAIDNLWAKLTAGGGGPAQCGGWLKDKFGLLGRSFLTRSAG